MVRRRRSLVLRCPCTRRQSTIATDLELLYQLGQRYLLIRERCDLLLLLLLIRKVLLVLLPVLSRGAGHDDGVDGLGLES